MNWRMVMPQANGRPRFKNRREAEQALREIIGDGGAVAEFRVEELPDGGWVIVVLERDGRSVAGMLGM
jgi:hypothetical protein